MSSHDFDDILVQLGMGSWNVIYVITAAYSCMLTPPQYLSGVYMVPIVNYTCLAAENDNVTSVSQDSCTYSRTSTGMAEEERVKCSNWHFHDEVFTSTITSEFELVCEQDYQRATYQATYLFGTLLGQYAGGYCADRFGRKVVVLFTHVALSVTAIGMVFLNNFTAILIFRFINGAVYLLVPFVLAMEVCPPKYRSTVGILAGLPWAFGTILWGAVAYFVREWRYLQLAVSIPSVLILIPIYLMDESPRWLIVQGQHDKALKVLKRAARWNKVSLPPDEFLLKLMKDIEKQTMISKSKQKEKGDKNTLLEKLRDVSKPKLFSTKEISAITSALCFNFFTVSLVFDGLNLSGDIYSSDPFLYIILGGIVEIPGYSLTAPLIHRFGRKIPTVINYFICGVVILIVSFIPSNIDWLVMTLVLCGKLFISAAYQTIYVYSTELFPTEVRSQGIGLVCVSQQVASVFSPYITTYIGPLLPWVPSVIFGGASLMSGIVTMTLHETKNVPLPDTIADLKLVKKSRKEANSTKTEMEVLNTVNSQDD